MSKKINSYFLIFIIMVSMFPVQAAAPTKYYEIKNCDVELNGAIFIDVDPSSFYASYNNGIIEITSNEHFENVSIRFKGIALINKLKKYNGFDVGYTHITDNGIITNELKSLEIDYQGFAYLDTDFSTVIINGMTGTTTATLLNQNGNISINVPNGTLYGFNITNNHMGVYSVNGYEWNYQLPYYQNASFEFTDAQYELNNTNFPINSTTFNKIETDGSGFPIVNFTDSNGTNINYWVQTWNSESDFKLYTKTTSGIENKSLYLYYDGNSGLNGGSNGSATFTQYHGAASSNFIESIDINYTKDTIFETRVKATTTETNAEIGVGHALQSHPYGFDMQIYNPDNRLYFRTYTGAGMGGDYDTFTSVVDKYYNYKIIHQSGVSVTAYKDGAQFRTPITTYLPAEDYGIYMYETTEGLVSDWAFIYYTPPTDPYYTIGTEQQAHGILDITTSINGDSNTQSYNTSQSREFSLTPTGTTNSVNINTSSTDYDVTVTTYWTDDTTLQTETVNNGYANQSINYTSNDYNVSADLNTTYTFNFSVQDYTGTATSILNDVSKTTTRNGQDVNASVGELTAGNPYWWNVTVLYNNIFTLSNQSDITAFLGVSKSFNDSDYNDPDNNPIASRLWKFGDGDTSSSSNPSHTYTSLGNLTANYTVTEDATTNSQTITKEFNVSVLVQPVQNLISTLDQTWIKFNWSDYSSADLWNIYELEESAPYTNETLVLDGIKDSVYDTVAHAFVFDTPNPQSDLNYETVWWARDDVYLHGYAEGYDADTKINDDYFKIGIDNTGNGLTSDDRLYELNEGGTVTADRWTGSQWIPTATNAQGVVIGAGDGGAIQYEMQIPLSELVGFVNGVTAKFMMERECKDLVPTVETFYPTNLINETDGSLWANATLTATPVYNYIGNTSISEYNSTGLTPYTWYRHQFITVNNSINSTPVYHDDITVDVPHYTVEGFILDIFGNSVAGATVFAKNGVVGEITQSDANGHYIGYNFEIGNYSIYGNKSGYQENFTNVYVTANMTNINVTIPTFEISDWEIYQELLLIQSKNDEILLNMSINNTIVNDKLDTILIFILLNMAVIVGIIIGRRGKENDN